MILTLATFPTVLKNSNIPNPFVQSRLLTTSTPPPPPVPCPKPLRSAYSSPLSKNLFTWAVIPFTFVSSSSVVKAFRSVLRPEGSPIEPVAPPIYHQLCNQCNILMPMIYVHLRWNVVVPVKAEDFQRGVKKRKGRHLNILSLVLRGGYELMGSLERLWNLSFPVLIWLGIQYGWVYAASAGIRVCEVS